MLRFALRVALVLVVTVVVVLVGQRLLAPSGEAEAVLAPTTPVRVAAVDLAVGTFLDDVEAPFQPWPDDELEESWTTDKRAESDDILGAVVIRTVPAGRPVARGDLLLPGQDGFLAAVLQPGFRAVSVAVDAVSGNAGHVFPGDRVDLILTQQLPAEARRRDDWVSETILEAVRVIAVDQNLKEDLTAREASRVVPRTFTLEVAPGDVERIAVASQLGRLSFSLRSLLAEGRPAHLVGDGATYASDVSIVRRAQAPAAEPEEPALRPRTEIRVLRGRDSDEVTAIQ